MATVETSHGRISGSEADGLHVFLGVPFAAPPVGELRWSPPADPDPWSGELDTTDWRGQAWQAVAENMGPLEFAFNAGSASSRDEDCLQLNIWTPGLDSRKRPVLVWIHGGGFTQGTGATAMYEGASLARRGDAVVVTINYRLGPMGFLNLNEVTGGRIPATGNEGLLDQVKALEWVRNNIERFGGDPSRVTIFGESAGGMSVGSLLAFEPARGLFHRAIPQSGACSTAQTLTTASETAQAVLDHAGISTNAGIEEFLAMDPEKLIEAGQAASVQLGGIMIFQPCIDGNLMTDLPIDSVKNGSADGIPVMVGATRDEWKLFSAMPGFDVDLDDATLIAGLGAHTDEPEKLVHTYRESRAARGQDTSANALFAAIETDRVFRIPAINLGEALSERGQSAWQYLFTWESPWGDGELGSPHAIDIGFVFGSHGMTEGSATFFGQGEAADALAEKVQDAWLAFAADGDPRGAMPDWAPYDTDSRATAMFGEEVSVENDPFGPERAVWSEINVNVGSL